MRAPGDAAREWAVQVDRDRPALAQREWKSPAGAAEARLTGFAAGDTLRLVREVVTQGEQGAQSARGEPGAQGAQGRQVARYYFAGPRLRYYEAEASRQPPDGGTLQRVRLVLAFDDRGEVAQGTYQVDGATAPLDSMVIRGVVARAAEVSRQWAATAGSGGAGKR